MSINNLEGRAVAVAGEPGALRDDVSASLESIGAGTKILQWDGETGPEVAGLKVEAQVAESLDRVMAATNNTDAVVFVGRDLADGEDMAEFIEETIAGFHFCLKLGTRLRKASATDVLAVASTTAEEEPAALAADIRNGALRQMCLVAATEGGPLDPPMLVNALFVSGNPGSGASESLSALLARLLRRPQGYVTGTTLRASP